MRLNDLLGAVTRVKKKKKKKKKGMEFEISREERRADADIPQVVSLSRLWNPLGVRTKGCGKTHVG